MKAWTLLLLLGILASLCHAADPAAKTVVVRYQPPLAAADAATVHGLIVAPEVNKAVRILKSSLRKAHLEVQLGTLPPAEGPGQLWIDGHPLPAWLGATESSARCVYCGRLHAAVDARADGCRVPAERIVQAGLTAGANRLGNGSLAATLFSERPATN